MPRSIPAGRVSDVARAAARVFIQKGYRRALLADVAAEVGLSQGALYRYVESKEALFHLALLYAMGDTELSALALPIPSPLPGETVGLVDKWLAANATFPALQAALDRRRVGDVRTELGGIVDERYDLVERSRRLLALIERSALDLPDLAEVYYRRSRRSQVDQLATYLGRRIRSGHFRPVPDPPTSARLIVETIAWFAWHRKGDADTATIDDDLARDSVRHHLIASFVAGGEVDK